MKSTQFKVPEALHKQIDAYVIEIARYDFEGREFKGGYRIHLHGISRRHSEDLYCEIEGLLSKEEIPRGITGLEPNLLLLWTDNHLYHLEFRDGLMKIITRRAKKAYVKPINLPFDRIRRILTDKTGIRVRTSDQEISLPTGEIELLLTGLLKQPTNRPQPFNPEDSPEEIEKPKDSKPPAPDVNPLPFKTTYTDEDFLKLIERTQQRIKIAKEKTLKQFGLSPTQFEILRCLTLQDEPIPQSELRSHLNLDPGDLTRALTTLEEKKWINRIRQPQDSRALTVTLLPIGLETCKSAETERDRLTKNLFCHVQNIEAAASALQGILIKTDSKTSEKAA
jgi:DNA-binding MarR family transcriptional regulator